MKVRLMFELSVQTGETSWNNIYKSILVEVPDTLNFPNVSKPVRTIDAIIVATEYERGDE